MRVSGFELWSLVLRDQPFRLCVCQRVKFRGRLKRGVNGYDSEARRVRVRHMTIGIYGIIAGIMSLGGKPYFLFLGLLFSSRLKFDIS